MLYYRRIRESRPKTSSAESASAPMLLVRTVLRLDGQGNISVSKIGLSFSGQKIPASPKTRAHCATRQIAISCKSAAPVGFPGEYAECDACLGRASSKSWARLKPAGTPRTQRILDKLCGLGALGGKSFPYCWLKNEYPSEIEKRVTRLELNSTLFRTKYKCASGRTKKFP